MRYAYFQVLSKDADGNTCIATVARPLPAGSTVADGTTFLLFAGFVPYPECPPTALTPAALVAAATDYWQHVPLPKPRPAIAPGWAITGKPSYFETNGELHHLFTTDTPLGQLAIDAVGAYSVDWGDGTTTGPHTSEGRPWPDGQITHTYIDVGLYDVVVSERWTAVWHFGANSGSLSQLRTTGRIDDFRVEQIQAVVVPG